MKVHHATPWPKGAVPSTEVCFTVDAIGVCGGAAEKAGGAVERNEAHEFDGGIWFSRLPWASHGDVVQGLVANWAAPTGSTSGPSNDDADHSEACIQAATSSNVYVEESCSFKCGCCPWCGTASVVDTELTSPGRHWLTSTDWRRLTSPEWHRLTSPEWHRLTSPEWVEPSSVD